MHTRSRLYQRSTEYGRIEVAQTLLSVLVMLGTVEKINGDSGVSFARCFRGSAIDEARAALEFQAAFRPVADQLALILASINYTIDLRMAPVAAAALGTYTIAKGWTAASGAAI